MNQTILIEHSGSYLPERNYIFSVIFSEFLGLSFKEKICKTNEIRITLHGDKQNRVLTLPDVLFKTPEKQWLKDDSMPVKPLKIWYLNDEFVSVKTVTKEIPIIYGKEIDNKQDLFFIKSENSIKIGIDILGSAFFMLTRYEEIVNKQRDNHNRFPAVASLAYQENFLERPIINEYIEILWFAMRSLWSDLKRKVREYEVQISHDVDSPLVIYRKKGLYYTFKALIGDIVLRRSIGLFFKSLGALIFRLNHSIDPYNTFDFIMDVSEKHNMCSTFYIKTDKTSESFDSVIYIEKPWFSKLFKIISERDHKIGLHPSYNTYRDFGQMKKELEKLTSVFDKYNIKPQGLGARQHYLRWENPSTWQLYEDSSLKYDSTLSYADHVGFRCGTCYEYPVYNLLSRVKLKLVEKPLIVMENTLFEKKYMNLQIDKATECILKLNKICQLYDGMFTFLVHNSFLFSKSLKKWYSDVIDKLI